MAAGASCPCRCSYRSPTYEECGGHDSGWPDAVERRRGALRRHRERVASEDALFALRRRRDAGKLVDRFEHPFGGGDAAHRLFAAELVPDFAVVRRRLLEEPD